MTFFLFEDVGTSAILLNILRIKATQSQAERLKKSIGKANRSLQILISFAVIMGRNAASRRYLIDISDFQLDEWIFKIRRGKLH